MIRIQKVKTKTAAAKYQLRIDNEVFNSWTRRKKQSDDRLVLYAPNESRFDFEIEVKDRVLMQRIAEHRFDELPKEIGSFSFDSVFISIDGDLVEPMHYLFFERTEEGFEISCAVRANLETWDAPFTAAEFISEYYKRLLKEKPSQCILIFRRV